jgi:hypothetical protein
MYREKYKKIRPLTHNALLHSAIIVAFFCTKMRTCQNSGFFVLCIALISIVLEEARFLETHSKAPVPKRSDKERNAEGATGPGSAFLVTEAESSGLSRPPIFVMSFRDDLN